jgi:hypothetical protein
VILLLRTKIDAQIYDHSPLILYNVVCVYKKTVGGKDLAHYLQVVSDLWFFFASVAS